MMAAGFLMLDCFYTAKVVYHALMTKKFLSNNSEYLYSSDNCIYFVDNVIVSYSA